MADNRDHEPAALPDAGDTWLLTIQTPMGEQTLTTKLSSDAGKLTGTMSGPEGDTPIIDGTASGATLGWKIKVTKPMAITLTFEVTIDGDTMTGTFKPGLFPKGKVTGKRA